jgi:glycosyltransferase involved in cell wall biosynthesis
MADTNEVIIEILISTCNERLANVLDVAQLTDSRVRYIIVHQLFNNDLHEKNFSDIDERIALREDIELIRVTCKGLSKSRNIALARSSAPYLLFADDDIQYLPDTIDVILQGFEDIPDADVITFRFADGKGAHQKSYPKGIMRHRAKSLFRVSSVEVALRREVVLGTNVRFDERFGLGSELPVSEENIFLTDLLKRGMKIFYYPADILIHPEVTSGNTWGKKHLIARGALFKRVFGLYGFPLLLVFLCRHGADISRQNGLLSGFTNAIKSFFVFSMESMESMGSDSLENKLK